MMQEPPPYEILGATRSQRIINVLSAIAVIGILIALLLPAVQMNGGPRRSVCSDNLKSIGIALHMYHDAFNAFPPGASGWIASDGSELSASWDPAAAPGMWGWAVCLLPYLEKPPEYHEYQSDYVGLNTLLRNEKSNAARLRMTVPTFICPSDDSGAAAVRKLRPHGRGEGIIVGKASYVGCIGADDSPWTFGPRSGAFAPNQSRTWDDFKDGQSVTLFVGERASRPASPADDGRGSIWIGYTSSMKTDDDGHSAIFASTSYRIRDGNAGEAGPNVNLPMLAFGGPHASPGANCLMVDGSVRFVMQSIDFSTADRTNPPSGTPGVFNRMGMIADGYELNYTGINEIVAPDRPAKQLPLEQLPPD